MGATNWFQKQTAVYWAPKVVDDFGQVQYEEPVELAPPNGVYWLDCQKQFVDQKGTVTICQAKVWAIQELKVDGALWLGELADVVDQQNPFNNPGAHPIRASCKIPWFNPSIFAFYVFLGQSQ